MFGVWLLLCSRGVGVIWFGVVGLLRGRFMVAFFFVFFTRFSILVLVWSWIVYFRWTWERGVECGRRGR